MLSRFKMVVGIGLVLVGACSDGFGPTDGHFEATYVLRAVNGQRLPATVSEGGGQRYIILGDTLRFSADGSVARSVRVRHLSATPEYPPDTTYHDLMSFPYVVERGAVIIGYRDPCPPNAICVGFEEGKFTPTGLRIVGRLLWSGDPVLEFRRVQ